MMGDVIKLAAVLDACGDIARVDGVLRRLQVVTLTPQLSRSTGIDQNPAAEPAAAEPRQPGRVRPEQDHHERVVYAAHRRAPASGAKVEARAQAHGLLGRLPGVHGCPSCAHVCEGLSVGSLRRGGEFPLSGGNSGRRSGSLKFSRRNERAHYDHLRCGPDSMPMTDFSWTKGQRVQLHSLVGRADLNGRTGTVTGMKDDGSGRVGVSVDGEQKAIALKASNLTVLDTAAEKAAAAKATEARNAVMRLASSLSGAHKPPEEVWQCRFCRQNLPASSYSQDQWSTLKRNSRRSCTGCDFRIPEQTGVRYTKAVAATTVIQARARGSLVRRGRAAPSSQATAATSGVKRAACVSEEARWPECCKA